MVEEQAVQAEQHSSAASGATSGSADEVPLAAEIAVNDDEASEEVRGNSF